MFVSHLHGDHFGGLPLLILDGQFRRRDQPLHVAGPPGIGGRLTEAMEVLFPGSSTAPRRFEVRVVELPPGATTDVVGVEVSAWEVPHPSGAPALALRLETDGTRIAYTGDTAWTDAIGEAAEGAQLLIAESYYLDKDIPHHLNHRTLAAHRDRLRCDRILLTHMSEDMLDQLASAVFDQAHDGLTVQLLGVSPPPRRRSA
ncbi:MAG: MBL fold metallo-hydrolase [Egibacteraceae bacterium]